MVKKKYELVCEEQLKKYAELAVGAGVNVQKNQLIIIHSDIENVTFARLIQTAAYDAGASNVVIDWTDEQSTKEFYLHAADDAIDTFPTGRLPALRSGTMRVLLIFVLCLKI